MRKIIQFPKCKSNGYLNLSALILMSESTESLNAYIDIVGRIDRMGSFLPGEKELLIEQGRAKRLELSATEPMEPEKVEKLGTYAYTPEMGQRRPDCQMEVSRSHYGKHVYIDTPLEIKGRGITLLKKYAEKDFVKSNHYKVGWYSYQVTSNAYDKLKEQYTISMHCCLD